MPSTSLTGHHAHVGGPHPCMTLWVLGLPGLLEVAHNLTEDPEDWGY